jgi:hypothetical protein
VEQQPQSSIAAQRTPKWAWWSCAGLIALHAVLLALSARVNSVTVDESAHLAAGAAYWKWGEFSVYNHNPPLLRLLGSWPAVVSGAEVPDAAKFRKYAPQDRFWAYNAAFQRANIGQRDYQRLFVLGRWAMIPVSCLGALLVFLWSRELYGPVAAVGACAIYALEPDILAHGSLVGTDLGTAVAMLLTLWLWQRFCRAPTSARAALAGVALGIANLCKFTSLLLWPGMTAMLVWAIFRDKARESSARRIRDLILGCVVASVLAIVTINLGYGYDRTFERLGALDLQSAAMQRLQHAAPWLPAPVPRQYVLGLDVLKWEADQQLPAFLLGQSYRGARWGYYPIALAVKLPIGGIVLLLLLGQTFLSASGRTPTKREWPLVISLGVLTLGIVFGATLNLGVRYLLPLYPLAIILVSRVWTKTRPVRAIAWLAVAALAVESFASAPRYLSFMNAFSGGPRAGYRIVNDSNLDWGQGLSDLKRWMDAAGVKRIGLACFGSVDPAAYGIDFVPLDELKPGEDDNIRFVAVSSYVLAGQRQRMALRGGGSRPIFIPYFRALQNKPPVAVPGNVMFVFRCEDLEAARESR